MQAVQLASLCELLCHLDLGLTENDTRLPLSFGLRHPRQRILQRVGHLDVAQLN